jgi:hypothetical protein
MKQFASWFTHGVRGGAALRKSIYEAKNGAAILEAVDHFFSRELASDESLDASLTDEQTFVPSLAAGE